MRRHSWEDIQETNEDIARTGIIAGAWHDVQYTPDLVPMLWLDFLNADTNDTRAMWIIYREFAGAMEDLMDWIGNEGHDCNQEMKDMKPLSKEEFIQIYPKRLQPTTEELQKRMRKDVEEDTVNNIMYMTSNTADKQDLSIQSCWITVKAHNRTAVWLNDTRLYKLYLHIPGAKDDNFWLSVILGSMVSYYGRGKVARRCADPDCGIYFVPSSRSHGQRYHSVRCQNHHYYMQKIRTRS